MFLVAELAVPLLQVTQLKHMIFICYLKKKLNRYPRLNLFFCLLMTCYQQLRPQFKKTISDQPAFEQKSEQKSLNQSNDKENKSLNTKKKRNYKRLEYIVLLFFIIIFSSAVFSWSCAVTHLRR
jgi:hypothetical protein